MEPSDISEAISRIRRMEACFSSLQHAASIADDPSRREKLRVLTDYYENGLWLQDYELDEQGLLPQDLKRGVLSQDAVYDLLDQICTDSSVKDLHRISPRYEAEVSHE